MHLKTLLSLCALVILAFTLSACAGPKFPETGTISIYDGKWAGTLESSRAACADITVKFEIRYSQAIGTVYSKGHRFADIWGTIQPNGELASQIGQLGVVGGKGDIKFTKDTATGTWSGDNCTGSAKFKRV